MSHWYFYIMSDNNLKRWEFTIIMSIKLVNYIIINENRDAEMQY